MKLYDEVHDYSMALSLHLVKGLLIHSSLPTDVWPSLKPLYHFFTSNVHGIVSESSLNLANGVHWSIAKLLAN